MTEIKVGQIWKEVDPRFERKVKIVKVLNGDIWTQSIGLTRSGREHPIRASKTERFNGKRGGYALHEDVSK